jgi:hypothetical protein
MAMAKRAIGAVTALEFALVNVADFASWNELATFCKVGRGFFPAIKILVGGIEIIVVCHLQILIPVLFAEIAVIKNAFIQPLRLLPALA